MAQGDFKAVVEAYQGLDRGDRIVANTVLGVIAAGALIGFVPPLRHAVSDVGELIGILPDTTASSYDSVPPVLEDLYSGAVIQAPVELPTGPAPTELPTLPEGFLAD